MVVPPPLFTLKLPSDWTNLPAHLVSISSFQLFKNTLPSYYKTMTYNIIIIQAILIFILSIV